MIRGRTCILLVSPLPPPAGGIARWTQLVTEYLKGREDLEIRVVNTALRLRSPRSTSRTRRLVAGSIEALWTILRCLAVTITMRPDVVHINISGQLGLARDMIITRWCRTIRIPVVVHLRFGRVPNISERGTREWRLLLNVMEAASVVVAIDASTAGSLAKTRLTTPVKVIPNCVDTLLETNATPARDQRIVIYVGWLVPSKGLEELLSAWQMMRCDGKVLRLLGGYEDEYIVSLRRRGLLTPDVAVLGEVTHSCVLNELRRCALFVLPSHTEGFPNVVVEAMSAGAPIVATSVGAVPEMLRKGAGIVVPPRDSKALAQAMLLALRDAEGSRHMGRIARQRAEDEFSVASVAQQYVCLWRSLALVDRGSP